VKAGFRQLAGRDGIRHHLFQNIRHIQNVFEFFLSGFFAGWPEILEIATKTIKTQVFIGNSFQYLLKAYCDSFTGLKCLKLM
jgi:hypothetical protein